MDGFHHQAVLYRDGIEGWLDSVLPFVAEGVERGEPVMVTEPPEAIVALEDALGEDSKRVTFVDMHTLGRNPARIIPEWLGFVDRFAQLGPVRGVGETAWAGRREAELEECRLHEALVNVAFGDSPAWQLLCPYDVSALPAAVIDDVLRTHPFVDGTPDSTRLRNAPAQPAAEFARPLSSPPPDVVELRFDGAHLSALRGVVRGLCEQVALTGERVEDLVLAAHEVAGNSVQHAGGQGLLRSWRTAGALVLEVADAGSIEDPLVGRAPVLDLAEGGRGVAIANQLCDLVQVRSSSDGTTVRLHTWL